MDIRIFYMAYTIKVDSKLAGASPTENLAYYAIGRYSPILIEMSEVLCSLNKMTQQLILSDGIVIVKSPTLISIGRRERER